VTLFPSGEAEHETRLLDGVSRPPDGGGFEVHLANFDGPFDLLLHLISRHKLDITEIALSQVTDEFIAYIKAAGSGWDLDQTSQFMVVAATLLDLKAARLIPSGEVEDPEDLALLEARDLLFARLLQYRAFQRVAGYIAATLKAQGRRYPRDVGLEPRFARLMPEVTISISPARLAALAAKAMAPKQASVLSLAHMHAPVVSVREQARVVVDRLRQQRAMTFRALTYDSSNMLTTVARFLALLELFRDGAVAFEQLTPLGELTVRWTGADDGEWAISDEFDETPEPPEADQ
jgi:segregation and condensation protein A